MTPKPINLTVVAIFRDEAPYLAEFIAFHLAQGVERFVFYNNRSADNWYPILEKFADVVDVIHWDMPAPSQMAAYLDYFHGVQTGREGPYRRSRWVAVLDVDEFLFVDRNESKTLLGVIDELGAAGAAGVGVNWMIYNGAEDHETAPGGLQIEAFIGRCDAGHSANRHIKSIVDPMRVRGIRDPHSFAMAGVVVDELYRQLPGPYTDSPSHTRLRINHYLIRSLGEWQAKVARGRADTGTFRDPEEYRQYPAMVADLSAACHSPVVRGILEQRGIYVKETVTA